jgi:hypothetical protein
MKLIVSNPNGVVSSAHAKIRMRSVSLFVCTYEELVEPSVKEYHPNENGDHVFTLHYKGDNGYDTVSLIATTTPEKIMLSWEEFISHDADVRHILFVEQDVMFSVSHVGAEYV